VNAYSDIAIVSGVPPPLVVVPVDAVCVVSAGWVAGCVVELDELPLPPQAASDNAAAARTEIGTARMMCLRILMASSVVV
jgi:hypothetical protein